MYFYTLLPKKPKALSFTTLFPDKTLWKNRLESSVVVRITNGRVATRDVVLVPRQKPRYPIARHQGPLTPPIIAITRQERGLHAQRAFAA